MILDAAGNLYGTAAAGGAHGEGTAFELTRPSKPSGAWSEAVLHDFDFFEQSPSSSLVMDRTGNLYGTALASLEDYGGYLPAGHYFGTVFELSPAPSGWKEHTLWYFGAGADGALPSGGPALAIDGSGAIYGTTLAGGAYYNSQAYTSGGTVYEIQPGRAVTMVEVEASKTVTQFPPAPLGVESTASVTIRNAGNGQLAGSLEGVRAPFSLTGSPDFVLGPNQTAAFMVSYRATRNGSHRKTVVVSNANNSSVILLIGGGAS